MVKKKRITIQPAQAPRQSHWALPLAAAILGGAALAVYHNCFHGQFVLDDDFRILANPGIRKLWPLWDVFSAPLNITRPIVQATFAVNYAIDELNPVGYHVVNLAIHIAVALMLYVILRRTLRGPRLRAHFGAQAGILALITVLLWTVHPLTTTTVTYIVQRGEGLMSLFLLLTLYCSMRAFEDLRPAPGPGERVLPHGRRGWQALALICCLVGMGCKEVMVAAPLLVFLYDYVFLSGSFVRSLRHAPVFYAVLGFLCAIPPVLQAVAPPIERAGYTLSDLPDWNYAGTEMGVILHYLQLACVPYPLCLDYGWPRAANIMTVVWPALVILPLLGLTLWALWRRVPAGFAGAWFFLILAPTTSVMPIKDAAFEQRMYLPLAGLLVLVVLGICYWARRLFGFAGAEASASASAPPAAKLAPTVPQRRRKVLAVIGWTVVPGVTGVFGALTIARNADYLDQLVLWSKNVAVAPKCGRGHYNLGRELLSLSEHARDKREEEELLAAGLKHSIEAAKLDRTLEQAYNNAGMALCRQGHLDEALPYYLKAVEVKPDLPSANFNLGQLFQIQGHNQEAIKYYRKALESATLDTDLFKAHRGLGLLLLTEGQPDEGRRHLQEAERYAPKDTAARVAP